MDLSKLKIGLHQINTISGDISGNLEKIKLNLLFDTQEGTDLSIFPETAISGYMCGSLWDREDFVKSQMLSIKKIENYIKEINYKGTVIIGFVDHIKNKSNGFPLLKNAAAIINVDKQTKIYHKQLLASADHHEDKKYFEPGNESKVFDVHLPNVGKIRIGILICEDIWIDDHHRNIPLEMVKDRGADLLININQSYFYYSKQEIRFNQLSKIAKFNKVPIISVNSCGVGDILKNIVIFDGGSMMIDPDGELIIEFPRFQEFNAAIKLSELRNVKRIPSFDSKFEEITKSLIFEQQEFFKLCELNKAQVHISGGIDSAVVACIVKEAMGTDNCVFITNPSKINYNSDSFQYAETLCKNLDVELNVNEIQPIVDEIFKQHQLAFDWVDLPPKGQSSVHAVLRTVQGLAASHQFGSGIVATGNHTEIVLNWSSFHDIGSIGVHAILSDLTKMEIYQLAKYLNEEYYKKEVIPSNLYNGKFKAAAELPDAMEDPIDYSVQSGICALLIRERKNKDYLMWVHELITLECMLPIEIKDNFYDINAVKKYSKEEWEQQVDFAIKQMKLSVYKAGQSAPGVIISPRSRGFSNRETLINKYDK